MCGISVQVHEAFGVQDDLEYQSSQSLRTWGGETFAVNRRRVKDWLAAAVEVQQ